MLALPEGADNDSTPYHLIDGRGTRQVGDIEIETLKH
jgi:hypothetical protein